MKPKDWIPWIAQGRWAGTIAATTDLQQIWKVPPLEALLGIFPAAFPLPPSNLVLYQRKSLRCLKQVYWKRRRRYEQIRGTHLLQDERAALSQ